MAKTINILAVQSDDNLVKYINDSTLITEKGLPLVAIPTTVGSGSEATHFSVVYMDYKKHSLSHIFMLPNYVIVDAELSYNIPQHILASSGIDALSQAVESYWAVKSTDKSKNFASKAIVLTLDALHDAVEGDERAIVKMSKASNLAGKAINITTTTAPHAISYSITTNFGISHGHAVALTLGKFFEINYNASASSINDPRGLDYLNKTMNEIFAMFGVSSHLECSREWYRIMIKINLEHNFKNIGIKTDIDIEKIVNHVDLLRIKNNPVLLNKSRIRKIFV